MPLTLEENQRIDQALEAARKILEEADKRAPGVMPVERELATQFPAMDPTGMYSALEMEFQQRRERILRRAGTKWPEVREYVEKALNTPGIAEADRHMGELSPRLREWNVACDTCTDEQLRPHLLQRRDELRNDPALRQYDLVLQGLEHMLGIIPGDRSVEISRAMAANGAPYNDTIEKMARTRNAPPSAGISTTLANLSNILYQSKRDVLNPDRVREDLSLQHDQDVMERYAGASMQRALEHFEALPGGIPLEERIVIGGRTGAELLNELGIGIPVPGENLTDEQRRARQELRRQELYRWVAAAVTAEPPVPVGIVPELEPGKLLDRPVELHRKGHEPQVYEMSLWKRFWSHFGFYKDERRRYDESLAYPDACDRVLAKYPQRIAPSPVSNTFRLQEGPLGAEVSAAEASAIALAEALLSDCMPGYSGERPYPDNPDPAAYQGRAVPRALLVGMLLEQGCTIEEILDPAKKREEKQAAGDRLKQIVKENDVDRYAGQVINSSRAMTRALEEKMRSIDVTDDKAVLSRYPVFRLLSGSLQDLAQQMSNEAVRGAMSKILDGDDNAQALKDQTNVARSGGQSLVALVQAKKNLYECALGVQDLKTDTARSLAQLMAADAQRRTLRKLLLSGVPLEETGMTPTNVLSGELSGSESLRKVDRTLARGGEQAEKLRCNLAQIALRGDYQNLNMEAVLTLNSGGDPKSRYRAGVRFNREKETRLQHDLRRSHAGEIQEIQDSFANRERCCQGLEKACFPKTPAKQLRCPLRLYDVFSLDSDLPRHFCIGQLLKKGLTMEEIMDPARQAEEKAQVGAEFADHVRKGDLGWVAAQTLEGLKKANEVLSRRLSAEKGGGLLNQRNLLQKQNVLYELGQCCQVLSGAVAAPGDGGQSIGGYLNRSAPEEVKAALDEAGGLARVTEAVYGSLKGKTALFLGAMGGDVKDLDQALQRCMGGEYLQRLAAERLEKDIPPRELISRMEGAYTTDGLLGTAEYSVMRECIGHGTPETRQAALGTICKGLLEEGFPVIERVVTDAPQPKREIEPMHSGTLEGVVEKQREIREENCVQIRQDSPVMIQLNKLMGGVVIGKAHERQIRREQNYEHRRDRMKKGKTQAKRKWDRASGKKPSLETVKERKEEDSGQPGEIKEEKESRREL